MAITGTFSLEYSQITITLFDIDFSVDHNRKIHMKQEWHIVRLIKDTQAKTN